MKTTLLSLIFAIFTLQSNAQCSENVTNFGNNTSVPSYNISGDVIVSLNTNNTVSIIFANNFSTASGPDVRLYLVKSNGKSINELKSQNPNNLENISFGLIDFSGEQSFTQNIPNNVDISEYDTVFFYCLQFNAFWDIGLYTPFSSTNCSVLNVDTFAVNKVSIYPNPAKNQIQVSNIDGNSTEIRIFNVLGKQVFHQSKTTEKTIDISSLNKGIYLVKIDIDGKSKTQKLVVN